MVITDFVGDADMTALGQKMAQGLPPLNSIQNVIDQRAVIHRVWIEIGDLLRNMDGKLVKTKAARDALKQPDDLAAVYDAAFDKVVGAPVRRFRETVSLA